jgi:DNA-binding transcriptional regulator GbsR (MarR family)
MEAQAATPEPDALGRAKQAFVERWAGMAAAWGVPRSMVEVHAVLFIEGRPMGADEIMSRLGISRGNASMTVRTLVEWGIVRKVASPGSRRELYEAEQDVMSLFATVILVRKRREIDPLKDLVSDCRAAAGGCSGGGSAAFERKLGEIDAFVQAADRLCADMLGERNPSARAAVMRPGAPR